MHKLSNKIIEFNNKLLLKMDISAEQHKKANKLNWRILRIANKKEDKDKRYRFDIDRKKQEPLIAAKALQHRHSRDDLSPEQIVIYK
jgi:hypothetical protein